MQAASAVTSHDAMLLRTYITDGVSWPFPNGPPPPRHYTNTWTVNANAGLVAARIAEMEEIDALERLPDGTIVDYVQPLHAIIKTGKTLRTVLDASRNLNDFMADEPLKYETVEDAIRKMYPGAWLAKLDLKDCFLSWKVSAEFARYLTFKFQDTLYRFSKMVFGLKNAPAACTLLLSVVSFAFSEAGITHVRYLDDFLIIGNSFEQTQAHLSSAINIFNSFGLIISPNKTEGPVQRLTFLGIVIDTINTTLECTKERRDEVVALAQSFLKRHTVQVRELESLAGKFSFAATCFPHARPFMRSMFDLIRSSGPQHYYVTLTAALKLDLQFWITHIDAWNGTRQWHPKFNIGLSSDSCREGFGFSVHRLKSATFVSWEELPPPSSAVVGRFSLDDLLAIQSEHIAVQWPELYSLYAALASAGPLWRDGCLLYFSDNQTNVAAINRMATASPVILPLLRAIALLCITFNIQVAALHVAGVKNDFNDWLSRPARHRYSFSVTEWDPVSIFLPPPLSDESDCPLFVMSSNHARTNAISWPAAKQVSNQFCHWLVPSVPTRVMTTSTKSSLRGVRSMVSATTKSLPTYG